MEPNYTKKPKTEKNVFKTVLPIITEDQKMIESERRDIGKFKQITIGEGSNVCRIDSSGLWLGAAKFADAPFRVDMDGKVYINNVLHA